MRRNRIEIAKWLGYSAKADTKLPEGIQRKIHNADIRKLNCVLTPGVSVPVLSGELFTSIGLSSLHEFVRFNTGHDNVVRYLCRDGNKIMLWNGTSWVQIDSAIGNTLECAQFMERNGVMIIATGDGSDNVPEWYGYCAEQFTISYNGTGITKSPIAADYLCTEANVAKPSTDLIDSSASFSHASWLFGIPGSTGPRSYCISLQYDGSTWSMPSDVVTVDLDSATDYNNNVLRLKINPATFSRRVTAIRIYSAEGYAVPRSFYRVAEITVKRGEPYPYTFTSGDYGRIVEAISGNYDNTTGVFTASDAQDWVADQYNGCVALLPFGTATNAEIITDTAVAGNGELTVRASQDYHTTPGNPFGITVTSSWWWDGAYYRYVFVDRTTEDLTTLPEMWAELGYGEDEDLSANYKLSTVGGGRQFIAGVYKGNIVYDSRVYYSNITPVGAYAYDVFRDASYIDVNAIGISNIVALKYDAQKLYIFGETGIAILSIASGSVFGWQLYRLVQNVGVIAPNSVMRIPDGRYAGGFGYLSSDGPRILYNGYSYSIGEAIIDDDNFPLNVTDLTEATSMYDPRNRYWVLSFPSNTRVFCYSMLTDGWITKNPGVAFNHGGIDDTNALVVSDETKLWTFSGAATETAEIETAAFTTGNEIIIDRVGLRYKSDGAVTATVYTDEVSSFSVSFSAASNLDTPAFKFAPHGTRCQQFYVAVSGFVELSRIYIEYHEVKSL